MTAPKSVDPAGFLREQLESASPDLLREMVKTFADALMSAEADAVCGAAVRRSAARSGSTPATVTGRGSGTPGPARSSWRSRSCGTGSYFPDWLLQHRRRAEQALVSVVATQLPAGGVDPAGGEARRAARRRVAVQVAGLGDGRASRRAGRGVPQPAAGRGPVHVRVGATR